MVKIINYYVTWLVRPKRAWLDDPIVYTSKNVLSILLKIEEQTLYEMQTYVHDFA